MIHWCKIGLKAKSGSSQISVSSNSSRIKMLGKHLNAHENTSPHCALMT